MNAKNPPPQKNPQIKKKKKQKTSNPEIKDLLIRVQAFERLTDRHPLLSPIYVSTKTQFFTQNCRLLGLNEFVWQIMLIFTFGLEKWIDFKPQPLDTIIQDITRLAVENILLFVVHPAMCNSNIILGLVL